MEKQDKPIIVNAVPGTYYLCKCGQSKNGIFCDGSHAGTEFTPHVETITESKIMAICACGKSQIGVFCDGSHKNS